MTIWVSCASSTLQLNHQEMSRNHTGKQQTKANLKAARMEGKVTATPASRVAERLYLVMVGDDKMKMNRVPLLEG
jgi:hypothetical protein